MKKMLAGILFVCVARLHAPVEAHEVHIEPVEHKSRLEYERGEARDAFYEHEVEAHRRAEQEARHAQEEAQQRLEHEREMTLHDRIGEHEHSVHAHGHSGASHKPVFDSRVIVGHKASATAVDNQSIKQEWRDVHAGIDALLHAYGAPESTRRSMLEELHVRYEQSVEKGVHDVRLEDALKSMKERLQEHEADTSVGGSTGIESIFEPLQKYYSELVKDAALTGNRGQHQVARSFLEQLHAVKLVAEGRAAAHDGEHEQQRQELEHRQDELRQAVDDITGALHEQEAIEADHAQQERKQVLEEQKRRAEQVLRSVEAKLKANSQAKELAKQMGQRLEAGEPFDRVVSDAYKEFSDTAPQVFKEALILSTGKQVADKIFAQRQEFFVELALKMDSTDTARYLRDVRDYHEKYRKTVDMFTKIVKAHDMDVVIDVTPSDGGIITAADVTVRHISIPTHVSPMQVKTALRKCRLRALSIYKKVDDSVKELKKRSPKPTCYASIVDEYGRRVASLVDKFGRLLVKIFESKISIRVHMVLGNNDDDKYLETRTPVSRIVIDGVERFISNRASQARREQRERGRRKRYKIKSRR